MGCTSGWLAAFHEYSGGGLRASVVRKRKLFLRVDVFLTIVFCVTYLIQDGGTLSAEQAYATSGEHPEFSPAR